MSDNKGVIETLNEYMVQVFDKNKDGVVTLKEFMSIFPNYAVGIAILFVDLLVLVAEYRVWDFGFTVTGNPYKAIGFVLVSAVPFYLGQVFWLYPRATFIQKGISIAFIATSLYTSFQFGAADLTQKYDINSIYTFMLELTAGYIVGTLIYIVIDPTIKANRAKVVAQDNANFEAELQIIARQVLASIKKTMESQKQIAQDFGQAEAENALNMVRGKKMEKGNQQPQRVFANDANQGTNSTKNTGENERGEQKGETDRPNPNGR